MLTDTDASHSPRTESKPSYLLNPCYLKSLSLAFEEAGGDAAHECLGFGADVGRRFALQREIGQLFGFGNFYAADQIFDLRNIGWRHAEFVHAHAEKERDHGEVAGDFAADAAPDVAAMRGVHGHFDEAQKGRVRRLIKMSDFFVQSIDSHCVLDQVVGSNGEESCPLGQS